MAQPGAEPVGPFPAGVDPDEYDRMRRRLLWTFPSGLFVVGSRDGDRRNAMTLNWATQVSFAPKLFGIGVEKTAFTHELITASGAYTVNTIDREDRAIVRKFTKPVDVDLDASALNGFRFLDGPVTGAPVLADAAAYIECEVRDPVDAGDHTFFIGEIVNAAFLKDEETAVLRMEDTRMSYGG